MNIIAFPVGTTNIFPIANSVNGGQLMTEFNVKSRESVSTPSDIKYIVGHSFTHSMDDFAVGIQKDNVGVTISSSCLEISEGRAVVNGHYVESLAPIVIDMLEANKKLLTVTGNQLYGDLAVGLRMMYSTEKTLAGSLKVENDDNYYEGVHVVILPIDEFILPEDSPNDESKVTAHLLLAKFHYSNGAIYESSIVQNPNKIRNISAERISNIDNLLSSNYLSASGLDPAKLYVLSGAEDVEEGTPRPTWQNATGALIKWDANHTEPERIPAGYELNDVSLPQAEFEYSPIDDRVKLVLPHMVNAKNYLYNSNGDKVYYRDRIMELPSADFSKNTGGVVTAAYTRRLKVLDEKLNDFYHVLGGNMLMYLDHLTDRSELPPLPLYKNKLDTYQSKASVDYMINMLSGQVDSLSTIISNLKSTVNTLIEDNSTVIDLLSFKSAFNTYVENFRNVDSNLQSQIETLSIRLTEHIARAAEKEESGEGRPFDPEIDPADFSNADDKKLAAAIKDIEILLNELAPPIQDVLAELSGNLDDDTDSRLVELEAFKQQFEDTVKPVIDELAQWKSEFDANIPEVIRRYIDNKFEVEEQTVEQYKDQVMNAVQTGIQGLEDRYHLNRQGVHPGDYVLVGQDMTVDIPETFDGRYPTTMYVARIGNCTSATYVYKIGPEYFTSKNREEAIRMHKRMLPDDLLLGGVLLNEVEVDLGSDNQSQMFTPPTDSDFNTEAPQVVLDLLDVTHYSGYVLHDYFAVRCVTKDENGNITSMTSYIYRASGNLDDELVWSDPIWITSAIPLATQSAVGGFLNVDPSAYGNGYVIRDDSGNLRLLDYDLLVTGVLAYQLGSDYTTPSGADIATIQTGLDNYINYRVCFPNVTSQTSDVNNCINLTIDLSVSESDGGTIEVKNIDSRFGTALYLHLVGSASSNTVINLRNIEKLKIDLSSLEGQCAINIYNCGLCYDATVLNALTYIDGLSLWYEKYEEEDPDILVDGMTVELVNHSGIATSVDYWSTISGGDYMFNYALKSITFGEDGSIIRIGLFITDDSTPNITTTFQEGQRIFGAAFKAPQSLGLPYPSKLFRKQLKVSGSFVTAYYAPELNGYVIKNNTFTALTQKYDTQVQNEVYGTISIYSKFSLVTNAILEFDDTNPSDPNTRSIDGWASGKFHVFYGGTID